MVDKTFRYNRDSLLNNIAKVYEMEQGTEKWHEVKLGRLSASTMAGILPGTRGAYKASRKDTMAEKVCEMITGKWQEGFTSSDMKWGTETEALARTAYELETDNRVKEVGFIIHPAYDRIGISPDGLCGHEGGVEIKCPKTATHLNTLLTKKIKPEYIVQMQTSMWVTGRSWWDFVSYDPRIDDPDLQMCIIRVDADPAIQNLIEVEALKFIDELLVMFDSLGELKK